MTDTTYRVVRQADQSFCVELTKSGTLPQTAVGFATKADAEAWIVEDKALAKLDPKTDQTVAWNGRP